MRSRYLLAGLLRWKGKSAGEYQVWCWSVPIGAVQTLGSFQLDFFLPQGKMRRRDQPTCMDGDSRTGKVTAASGTWDEGR